MLNSQLQTGSHQERTNETVGLGQAVCQPLAPCLPESRLIPETVANRTESQHLTVDHSHHTDCLLDTLWGSSKSQFPSLLKLFLFWSPMGPENAGKAKEGWHRACFALPQVYPTPPFRLQSSHGVETRQGCKSRAKVTCGSKHQAPELSARSPLEAPAHAALRS